MEYEYRLSNTRVRMLVAAAMALTLLFTLGMGQRGNAPGVELSVEAILSGTRGTVDRTEPTVAWITSSEELERLTQDLQARQPPATDSQEDLSIDFSVSRVLLVRMGQQPTAGYGLGLAPVAGGITDRIALINLVWKEPAQGMATAQVITNPFMLLKISRGGYDTVKVVDQHGQTRFELSVAQGTEIQ